MYGFLYYYNNTATQIDIDEMHTHLSFSLLYAVDNIYIYIMTCESQFEADTYIHLNVSVLSCSLHTCILATYYVYTVARNHSSLLHPSVIIEYPLHGL